MPARFKLIAMRKISLSVFMLLFGLSGFCQTAAQLDKNKVLLPNGWTLTPAGTSLPLGDLPLNMAVSASGKYLAVTNNGQGPQSVQLFDAVKEKQLDKVSV